MLHLPTPAIQVLRSFQGVKSGCVKQLASDNVLTNVIYILYINTPLKTNMSPEKGTISIGNTSSNH